MKLLFDIGNHRIKWTTSEWLCQGIGDQHYADSTMGFVDTHHSDLADRLTTEFHSMQTPDSIWISSVADPGVNEKVKQWCLLHWNITPTFAVADRSFDDITNEYENPRTLGIDRWAAIIAARKLAAEAVLVIDMGTAVTIDYVSHNGIYKGGVIFPGICTMLRALNYSTGQIESVEYSQSKAMVNFENDNTRHAVENGVLLCVYSAIESAVEHFQTSKQGSYKIYLTGGDADKILSRMKFKATYMPELVLIGLLIISGESLI